MNNSSMNWLTTRYQSSVSKDLRKKFEIRGIPSLVILSPSGKLISRNGRGHKSIKRRCNKNLEESTLTPKNYPTPHQTQDHQETQP